MHYRHYREVVMKKSLLIATICVAIVLGCTSADCPQGYCVVEVVLPQQDDEPELDCGESPQMNACITSIVCDFKTGEWTVQYKDCDDGNPSTIDFCDKTTGECMNIHTCKQGCMDDDPCTMDYCDIEVGCVSIPLCKEDEVCIAGICEFRCTDHSDCDDGNPCTMNSCDLETGLCVYTPVSCDDGNPLTQDFCKVENEKKICVHIVPICEGDGDDGNPCTLDICVRGEWEHFTFPCGTGTACDPQTGKCEIVPIVECVDSSDCDDGNPCTDDLCVMVGGNPQCVHNPKECSEGEMCNYQTGECVALDSQECDSDPLGPTCDDGNPSTLDFCQGGSCINYQPVNCGDGTTLNPETGLCEVSVSSEDCVDGNVECVIFEHLGTATVSKCQEGRWFILNDCGLVSKGNYCRETKDGPMCQLADSTF